MLSVGVILIKLLISYICWDQVHRTARSLWPEASVSQLKKKAFLLGILPMIAMFSWIEFLAS
jgi:hypothetical protein